MNVLTSPADVERFRTQVGRRLGLRFEDDRLDHLTEVLGERMIAVGTGLFDAYLERLEASEGGELRLLAEKLTVCETYFFRYWDHFRVFEDVVLPERLGPENPRRRLRVLSAGCASGEEAYSLAIMVRQRFPHLDPRDVSLRAIDINPRMLERAARARYSAWSLRETSEALRGRYFQPCGREFQLEPSVHAMVSFAEGNLVEDDPTVWQPNAFDVVFCRNVMMYFDAETTRAVVARIARSLSPGGYLFLGHAETLRGVSSAFHLCHTHETFYYQRRDVAPASWRDEDRAAPLRAEPPADGSWLDAIQRASDRIAELSTRTVPPSREPTREPPPGPDADLDAELLRAVLLTNRGHLGEAERTCESILAADELNAGAHYLVALCREHAGDRTGALDHDRTATYLDPGFVMPYLHRGLLARQSGDSGRARAEFQRALALLAREEASRILLFGGGFSRESLAHLCRSELQRCGGEP